MLEQDIDTGVTPEKSSEGIIRVDPVMYFHLTRMESLYRVRQEISNPNFKLRYYGEVPLYPEHYDGRMVKGLKHGLGAAITSEFGILNEMGYLMEARTVLDLLQIEYAQKEK